MSCPCDVPYDLPDGTVEYQCPYDAQGVDACRCYCGVGVDEDSYPEEDAYEECE